MWANSYNPQPGAKRFLNLFSLILIIIFLIWFLYITEQLSTDVEEVYLQRTVNDINSTLALSLYEFAVKGELAGVEKFQHGNPFVFLAAHHKLPENYLGVANDINSISRRGVWLYEKSSGDVVYKMRSGESVVRFSLVLDYLDLNKTEKFEADIDRINSFSLKEKGLS